MLAPVITADAGDEQGATQVAYAPAAERSVPQVPKIPFAAIAAAVVIAGVIAFAVLTQLGTVTTGKAEFSNHALASQRMWEAERLDQLGYMNPTERSAREWELQHRQLTGSPN